MSNSPSEKAHYSRILMHLHNMFYIFSKKSNRTILNTFVSFNCLTPSLNVALLVSSFTASLTGGSFYRQLKFWALLSSIVREQKFSVFKIGVNSPTALMSALIAVSILYKLSETIFLSFNHFEMVTKLFVLSSRLSVSDKIIIA